MSWQAQLLCALALLCGCTIHTATRIDGVCLPFSQSSGTPRPQISNVFRADVECALLEQNRTVLVREYYDYTNNRGRIYQLDETLKADAYYDYNDNQIAVVDTESNLCAVEDLSKSNNPWMFGYRTAARGPPHIFGPSGALHFGDSPEVYRGKTTVRGIHADRWDSCQYSEALNATMSVTWYFSSKTNWDMQLGQRSVPLRAQVVGMQYKRGTVVPFSHLYDLYNFQQYVYPEDFEMPVGVVCPGRVDTKPFPSIPDRFSFASEVFSYTANLVTYVEEAYDKQTKINVYRFKPQPDATTLLSENSMVVVNDFNSGISYIQDMKSGTCRIDAVGNNPYSFVKAVGSGKVTMRDPADFFGEQDSVHFTYAGVRRARNVPCELWVARSDQVPGYTDRNVTIEWYFALPRDGQTWNTASESEWRIPIQFRMWNEGETTPIYETNMFYYDVTRPKLIGADISNCFHGSERRRFTFDIDGRDASAVRNNVEMFKHALTASVSSLADISPLRVSDIQLYFDVSAVHVSFDMLDKSNVTGDVPNVQPENDLSAAVTLYTKAVASNNFHLSLGWDSDNEQTLTPVPGSAAEVVGQSASFTAGALAGLGVAMFLVGSAGGATAAFFSVR